METLQTRPGPNPKPENPDLESQGLESQTVESQTQGPEPGVLDPAPVPGYPVFTVSDRDLDSLWAHWTEIDGWAYGDSRLTGEPWESIYTAALQTRPVPSLTVLLDLRTETGRRFLGSATRFDPAGPIVFGT